MHRSPLVLRVVLTFALSSVAVACVTPDAAPPARHRHVAGAPEAPSTQGSEVAAPLVATVDDHRIMRARLVPELDAGIGRFLGTVRVEGVLQQGRFVGFRIVGFHDTDGRYLGVDLVPGDVVTRVNGSAIERPEQALAVWNALRVNSELCVEYLRDGQRREIRYAIVD